MTHTRRSIVAAAILMLTLIFTASDPAISQTKTYEGALGIPFANEIRANETRRYYDELMPLVKAARGDKKSPAAKSMLDRFKNQYAELSKPGAQPFPDDQAYSVAIAAAEELFKGYVRSDRLGIDYLFSNVAAASYARNGLKGLEERLKVPGADQDKAYRDLSTDLTTYAKVLTDTATKTLKSTPAVTAEQINLTVQDIMLADPTLTKAQAEKKLADVRQELLSKFRAISSAKQKLADVIVLGQLATHLAFKIKGVSEPE